jgi:endonuclease/exonuclease/phosphatase family metal-dependent hydrolase
VALTLMLGSALACLSFPVLISGARDREALVQRVSLDGPVAAPAVLAPGTFRVLSLNLAHGRADGRFQGLRSRRTLEANLQRAGALVRSHRPHAVALQEADGPSVWSGRFDHVATVARSAGMPWSARSTHVAGAGLHYGTGALSWTQPTSTRQRTFAPSPPTMSKGATLLRFATPEGQELTLVSVHLDFAREKVRARQAQVLSGWLKEIEGPLILAGDFNCQWGDREATLRELADALGLRAWEPESTALATFPGWDKRLDWVLISEDLEFVDYRVLPEVVSDHRAIVADLRVREVAPPQGP